MKLYRIEDVKEFMELLFLKDIFDKFCVGSMELKTFVSISVKGNLLSGWLDAEEQEKCEKLAYVPWRLFQPTAFSLIRGKQTPKMLRIQFVHYMENGDCGGLRVQYENNELTCMSSYTLADFSLDKGPEQLWDENCAKFFKKNNIVAEEVMNNC